MACSSRANAIKAAAADGLLGDQPEPTLDQVEPPGAGRSEVELETRVCGQPLSNRRMFMGFVVVADQVQLPPG